MDRLVAFCISAVLAFTIATSAFAKGPYGSIHVGGWSGGAFTDDKTGAFSHCGAGGSYKSGIYVILSEDVDGHWTLGFLNVDLQVAPGLSIAVILAFDGINTEDDLLAISAARDVALVRLSDSALSAFRRSHVMTANILGTTHEFDLPSTDRLAATIQNCRSKMQAAGIGSAGDFSLPNSVVQSTASSNPKPSANSTKTTRQDGTGFVISKEGHIITNNHVVDGCVGEIHGNLSGQGTVTLRTVAADGTNDLALLQATQPISSAVSIRATSVHPGDSIIAIGYPLHGLLTSDFTVTSGIVSSLSGLLNDTRYLQISAEVQSGNSGGPLLDTSGNVVGVVSAKINALKFAKVTGDLPQNINFAIKTGAMRDFLDNSAVPYETAESKQEFKTADIASKARAYTLLISCTAKLKD